MMTPPRRAATRRALVAVTPLLISACEDESTAPVQADIDVHIAHAATGVGEFVLSVGSDVVANSFDAGDAVVAIVPEGRHTVLLDGADQQLAVQRDWRSSPARQRVALVLLNPADPEFMDFEAVGDAVTAPAAFRLINGVPGDADLTIELSDGSTNLDATAAFARTVGFGVQIGRYTVSAYFDDPGSAVELGEVEIDEDVHFVVVGPDESGTEPGLVIAF